MDESLRRLESRYDEIVTRIYRAGSGHDEWERPIGLLADSLEEREIRVVGVAKIDRRVQWTYRGGEAGASRAVMAQPGESDARLARAGNDDGFADKIFEDDRSLAFLGATARPGSSALSAAEKAILARLGLHFTRALEVQHSLPPASDRQLLGVQVLETLRQPVMLVDHERRIAYRNAAAAQLLARGDVASEVDGAIGFLSGSIDQEVTIALRELGLAPAGTYAQTAVLSDRKFLRLARKDGHSVAAMLVALRPEASIGSFGRAPRALLTIFEPEQALDIDPLLLSALFGLAPAESRLAARIVNGRSPEQCATDLEVKISTIRTRLAAIYAKTGASGKADLIRLVVSATAP